jgi:hypothetical protein
MNRQFGIEVLGDAGVAKGRSVMMVLRDLVDEKKRQIGFEIVDYPIGFFDEDTIACFLFDLDNIPFKRVVESFERDGGSIKLKSELPYRRVSDLKHLLVKKN